MMTAEMLETLSTPGAIAISLFWIHSRLNHVERCLDCIATNTGAQLPRKQSKWKKSLLPALAVSLPLLAGCANITQEAKTEKVNTDGSYETRTITSRVSAIGDARSLADKLTVIQDKQQIGAEGADTSATSTNAAATVDALTRLLEVAK